MDRAALDPVVLDAVEQMIGPGAQFSLTCATQVHPGPDAQMLHYEQGIYPLPRDRDVTVTAIWALDDFTAGNGATRVIPGSHRRAAARQETSETMPAEMPAGSVLLFTGRLWRGAGTTRLQPAIALPRVHQRQAPARMAAGQPPPQHPVTHPHQRGREVRFAVWRPGLRQFSMAARPVIIV